MRTEYCLPKMRIICVAAIVSLSSAFNAFSSSLISRAPSRNWILFADTSDEVDAASEMDWPEVFRQICCKRHACKTFLTKPVPGEIIADLLKSCQRSPSAFNSQPYKAIVVSSDESKKLLSDAMLSTNKSRVLDAGASVIFAADLNVMMSIGRLQQLSAEGGCAAAFVEKLPLYLSVVSSGHNRIIRPLATGFKSITFSIARRFGAELPPVDSAKAWAYKNTMLAAQSFMLSATSHGLASCPMEGFDPRRLRKKFRIPRRYAVPLVIAVGYPDVSKGDSAPSLRYRFEDTFYRDKWEHPYVL